MSEANLNMYVSQKSMNIVFTFLTSARYKLAEYEYMKLFNNMI